MYFILKKILKKTLRLIFRIRWAHRFRYLGKKSFFVGPYRLDGPEWMSVGDGSFAQRGLWIYCDESEGIKPDFSIGKDCVFGYNNHIGCIREIKIGNNVLTANNVYISDNIHSYENINVPIIEQPVVFKGKVSIGDGTWIGENAAIIGAIIGKNCVIGANAVVTKDVPDYSVVVGIPGRIIRKFDIESQTWKRY